MDPGEQGTRRVHGALGVVAVAAPAVEPDQEPVDAELVAEGATAPARGSPTEAGAASFVHSAVLPASAGV